MVVVVVTVVVVSMWCFSGSCFCDAVWTHAECCGALCIPVSSLELRVNGLRSVAVAVYQEVSVRSTASQCPAAGGSSPPRRVYRGEGLYYNRSLSIKVWCF